MCKLESSPSTPKKKRTLRGELSKEEKNSRKQLFSKRWLEEEVFKHWLVETEDVSKAKCKACNLYLGTNRSDLINHAKSQKYLKCMKSIQNTPKNYRNISAKYQIKKTTNYSRYQDLAC